MSKIIGVTVGTPTSPKKIEEELKPVKTVNGIAPDKNGNVNVSGSGGSGGGVFYVDVDVNVTTEDITEITTIGEANKTLAEVSAAYNAGQNIVLRVNWLGVPVLMPMAFLEESLAFFTAFIGAVTDGMPDSVYSAVMADDSSVLINAREITVGGVTDEHINSLIDAKLGVIENGTY